MKRKFYVHIGWPKTGTSFIQAYFDINREHLLKKSNILYPNIAGDSITVGGCFNHRLLWANPLDWSLDRFSMIEKADPGQHWKILLSTESPLKMNFIEVLKDARDQFEMDIYIIAYLRRQDHWVESAWKQWVLKLEGYNKINDFVDSIMNDDKLRYTGFLDYYKRLEPWKEAFGKEKLIIRVYEREQLKAGIIKDISKIIGLKHLEDLKLPDEANMKVNPGFNRESLELLSISKSLFEHPDDNRPFEFMYETMGKQVTKGPYESYGLLSPQQRIEILKKYGLSNEKVAREYLGREDGRLFYESGPSADDLWEPFPGLELQATVPMLMSLAFDQYKKLKVSRQRLQQLENKINTLKRSNEKRGLIGAFLKTLKS